MTLWYPGPAYVGRHRAPKPTRRPVAPLAPKRPLGFVELECVALFTVLRHLADGLSVDDAWARGRMDALDILHAQEVAS